MLGETKPLFAILSWLLLSVLIFFQTCTAQNNHLCSPSLCGNLHNISSPFRLRTDPLNCGFHWYELSCENNQTVLYWHSGKYYVQSIDYTNYTIRIVDANLNRNDCSTLPTYSLSPINFTYGEPYESQPSYLSWTRDYEPLKIMLFMSCRGPVSSSFYIDTAPCTNQTNSYIMIDGNITDVQDGCTIDLMYMTSMHSKNVKNVTPSFKEVHNELVYGIEISWIPVMCTSCRGEETCYLYGREEPPSCSSAAEVLKTIREQLYNLRYFILVNIALLIAARAVLCSPCVVAFIIYKWRRRHLSMFESVEKFLQGENNLTPIRYSFSEIRKMTNGFSEKLGEGGYGSVYKGKLRSGQFAAIKMLNNTKADGQEFINEVATIGRIYHVNVVRLIGFCAEGSKRALVYDFMPNGSLDKYVLAKTDQTSLTWQNLDEIALGVARGIEYLHRGCDIQILHFDIKPHNILLDKNFTPKVSDFGLAKFYPVNNNTVSLTAVRGTIGYIAPELFYKNIGGVSYKVDVYSYGMLILEMAGKKKKVNGTDSELLEDESGMYFPNWVFKEVVEGKMEIEEATKIEKELERKMVIVGLWCIQFKPSDRPSMDKVVEMLEGDVGSLELPPKPVLFPEESRRCYKWDSNADDTWSSSGLLESETVSLLQNSG